MERKSACWTRWWSSFDSVGGSRRAVEHGRTPPMCWQKSGRPSRVDLVGETLRAALNVLAIVAPDWLRAQAQPEWVERYDRPAEDDRLLTTQARREALDQHIGVDGAALLQALRATDAPRWLGEVPAVEVL